MFLKRKGEYSVRSSTRIRIRVPLTARLKEPSSFWLSAFVHIRRHSPLTLTFCLLIEAPTVVSYYFYLSFYGLLDFSVTKLLRGTSIDEKLHQNFFSKTSVRLTSLFLLNSIIFGLKIIIFGCVFKEGHI